MHPNKLIIQPICWSRTSRSCILFRMLRRMENWLWKMIHPKFWRRKAVELDAIANGKHWTISIQRAGCASFQLILMMINLCFEFYSDIDDQTNKPSHETAVNVGINANISNWLPFMIKFMWNVSSRTENQIWLPNTNNVKLSSIQRTYLVYLHQQQTIINTKRCL